MCFTCFFFFSSWREGTNEDDHERLSIWYSRYGAPAMFAVIIKKGEINTVWKETQACVWDSIQVVENKMNSYGKRVSSQRKQPSMHEHAFSSCPLQYAFDVPPLLVGCWGGGVLQQGNACCIAPTTFNAELLMPQRSHHEHFFPFFQRNKPASPG